MEIKIIIDTSKEMKIIEILNHFRQMNTTPPVLEGDRISKEDYLKKIEELKKECSYEKW